MAMRFPKQIGPNFVARVMPWVETFWHGKKRYPTVDEFMTKFNFTALEVERMNLSPFWIKSCERRGIRITSDSDLSPKQVAAISLITNFSDRRPITIKMAAIGVTEEELNGWYADPQFTRELNARADQTLELGYAEVQAAFMKEVQKGNFQAIKFYYEVTGRTKNEEAQNLKAIVTQLIEAVQKHVQEPEVLAAIANEIQSMQQINNVLALSRKEVS